MERYAMPDNINTVYVQADSFPNGVMAAHKQLRELIPAKPGRRFFGISWSGKNAEIIYRAAAEQLFPGEPAQYRLETFVIRKGDYISELLTDWRAREGEIGRIFREMLKRSDIAADGYCLEEYLNETDLRLMVTLA